MRNIVFVLAFFLVIGCGKDNYDAPNSDLSGRVTYKGEPVGVRGSNESVRLQLWQDGFELKTPINVFVTQDGSFSAKLFNGTYKLITVPGNGPWAQRSDTVIVELNGSKEVDFEVDPYFTLSDISYTLNGNILTANFTVEQMDTAREISAIRLFVGDTQFVDVGHFLADSSLEGSGVGTHSISMDVEELLGKQSALFARVGLSISGITEAVYDPNIYKVK